MSIPSTGKSVETIYRQRSPREGKKSPPNPLIHLVPWAVSPQKSSVTSVSSQHESLLGQTGQVTAFCLIPVVFVVCTQAAVSGALAACCFLPVIRSSAYVMVGLVPEWSELSMVLVERASKINSVRFHPYTRRCLLPMSTIFPVPRMMISRQCPNDREGLHSQGCG